MYRVSSLVSMIHGPTEEIPWGSRGPQKARSEMGEKSEEYVVGFFLGAVKRLARTNAAVMNNQSAYHSLYEGHPDF